MPPSGESNLGGEAAESWSIGSWPPPWKDVEVELISGSVWIFRDGRIARVEFYANREDLREATGLRR